MLKLVTGIKVVLGRLFAPTDHQDDFSDTRGYHLYDHVLNNRSVTARQELLTDRLGRRQHTHSKPNHWDNCFLNRF